jgi:hypothetical protein
MSRPNDPVDGETREQTHRRFIAQEQDRRARKDGFNRRIAHVLDEEGYEPHYVEIGPPQRSNGVLLSGLTLDRLLKRAEVLDAALTQACQDGWADGAGAKAAYLRGE